MPDIWRAPVSTYVLVTVLLSLAEYAYQIRVYKRALKIPRAGKPPGVFNLASAGLDFLRNGNKLILEDYSRVRQQPLGWEFLNMAYVTDSTRTQRSWYRLPICNA